MNTLAHIHTVHYAHICIIESHGPSDDLRKEIEEKTRDAIMTHAFRSDSGMDSVEEDPEFCCQALTEVGLRGTSLADVTAAANEIAEWADAHTKLKLIR